MRNTKSPYSCVYLCYWSFDLPDFAHREYLPELARVRAQRDATLQKQKEDSTARMLADLSVDRASDPNFAARDRWNPDEEEEEEDDGGELNIIDRSTSIISRHSAFPFAFRLSRHNGYSEGICLAARCMTGVDVACSVYPLLASLADLIMCHACLEAMDGVKRECLTSLLNCDFLFLFLFLIYYKIVPSAVLTSTCCR